MGYEYLDHTADAKFKAYGKTLEEAFQNSAYATFGIIKECRLVKPAIMKRIEVSSNKIESLLYDFLQELLFLLDTEGYLLSRIDDLHIQDLRLTCLAFGDNSKGYDISGDIKSMTYNDMEIRKTEKGFEITAVLDI